MASWPLSITLISAKDLKARDVRLAPSLSGDERDKKQRTPVHKKGSTTNPWLGHTFEFTVEEATLLDTLLEFNIEKKEPFFFCFKKGSFFGRKTTYVVGKVDVPVRDLLLDGCAGDMNPKVLSCEVWPSSPTKTKGKTMAVLEFSYKFGERLPVEPPLELEDETVTATQAAATPPEPYAPPMPRPLVAYQQNAAPNFPAADPYPPPIPAPHHQTAYVPNATPTYFSGLPAGYRPAASLRHPGWNLLGRVGIAAAVNTITSAFNNPGFDGVDFIDAWF